MPPAFVDDAKSVPYGRDRYARAKGLVARSKVAAFGAGGLVFYLWPLLVVQG